MIMWPDQVEWVQISDHLLLPKYKRKKGRFDRSAESQNVTNGKHMRKSPLQRVLTLHLIGQDRPKKASVKPLEKGPHKSQVAHHSGLISSFSSMRRLGVFPLPRGWDASPSQGYPQH